MKAKMTTSKNLTQHYDYLYQMALSLCNNPHDAEDYVQEAYLNVLDIINRGKKTSQEIRRGYLAQTLKRIVYRRMAQDQKRGEAEKEV